MVRRLSKGNADGEVEKCGTVRVTHRFVNAPGAVIPIRWHYVEAGDPSNPTIVFIHGNPESWHSWHPQIEHFASAYHIIAIDLKGYAQGDKRPGDWRWEICAEEALALFRQIGLKKFYIVSHDRGSVLADYLCGNHAEIILGYVRLQQICHIWKAENSPQSFYFADPIFGPNIFGDPDFYFSHRLLKMLKNPVTTERLEKFKAEMSYEGLEHAVIRYFQSSSFEKERLDRTSRLLRKMNFPVLLLQGDADDGQPRYYYADDANPAAILFPNARLEFLRNVGHYSNLEKPELVTASVETFLRETR